MDTTPARVTYIRTDLIEPNPHNPRRLFDEVPMKILKESIKKLGILVPLNVYPKSNDCSDPNTDPFVLLDGERRWRCAKELKKDIVPSIIIEKPSEEQNILTMFHIHNVREGWQLMPTALKLKLLMKKMGIRSEKKLAELTKLTVWQVRRCKILLTYPGKHQKMMLETIKEERFKADFFIDLQRIRGPALIDEFPPWIKRTDIKCIDIMIDKYKRKIIKAVTEFRDLASIYSGAKKKNKKLLFMSELDKFLSTSDMPISEIYVPGASFEKEVKEITRSTKRLLTQLDSFEIEGLASNVNLVDELKKLAIIIDNKLGEALLYEPRESKPK